MQKIILTVDAEYVDWTVEQGIREIMQNGLDAEKKGFPLFVSHNASRNELLIRTDGTFLKQSTLLIGYSTKKGDNTQIGEFGEGYKLGTLSLLKRGKSVRIETLGETWIPALEHHDGFDRTVLSFNIEKNDNTEKQIAFTISDISEQMWQETKKQFLMFHDKRKFSKILTQFGEILSGPDYAGRIFVGGIFVEHASRESFRYGYNFSPGIVSVDRDRKMASRYELSEACSKAWISHALSDGIKDFENLLMEGTADVKEVYNIPSSLHRTLQARFIERYGEGCIPVSDDNDATEAGHYGKRGKVLGYVYARLVGTDNLSLSRIREAYGKEAEETLDVLILSRKEQKNLLKAKEACALSTTDMPRIDICRFAKNSNVLGLYKDYDYVILNRSILKDYGRTLNTLVHEIAHREGGDGSRNHLDEICRMFVSIATKGKQTKL